jgi:hypothetical protein
LCTKCAMFGELGPQELSFGARGVRSRGFCNLCNKCTGIFSACEDRIRKFFRPWGTFSTKVTGSGGVVVRFASARRRCPSGFLRKAMSFHSFVRFGLSALKALVTATLGRVLLFLLDSGDGSRLRFGVMRIMGTRGAGEAQSEAHANVGTRRASGSDSPRKQAREDRGSRSPS